MGYKEKKTRLMEWIHLYFPKCFPDLNGQIPAEMWGHQAKAFVCDLVFEMLYPIALSEKCITQDMEEWLRSYIGQTQS